MAGEPQSEDMDATQIAERHVIERYLANQLSDAEADAFEAYVESHPEMTRQIELVARMKSGLGVLRRRGELQSVMNTRPHSWTRHPAFLTGVAASIVVAALLVFRYTGEPGVQTLATSFEDLRGSKPLRLGASLSLVRARGSAYGGEVELPADGRESFALQLTLVTGETGTAGRYAVEILRLQDGGLRSVAKLDNAAVTADGDVNLFVHTSVFSAGAYVVRLTAAGSNTPIEFTMRVTSAETG